MGFITEDMLDPVSAAPSGGRFISPEMLDPDPTEQARSRIDDSFLGNFKDNIVSAANTAFPFADEGAAGLRSILPGYGSYDEELAAIRQGEKDYATVHPYQSAASGITGALATAPLLPSGIAGRASIGGKMMQAGGEGAAYGIYQGYGSGEGVEDRLSKAQTGGIVGGVASPAIVGVAQAASRGMGRAAEAIRPPTADEAAIQALRITGSDIGKNPKLMSSLQAAQERGVFAAGESPADWIAANQQQIEDLGQGVSGLLSQVDAARVSPFRPTLSNATNYIKGKPQDAQKLLEQLQRRMDVLDNGVIDPSTGSRIIDPWDGTIQGLNEQKRALYRIGYKANTDSAGLDRALASDLKEAIENQAGQVLGPAEAEAVKALNAKQGQHLDLRKLLARADSRLKAADTRGSKEYGLTSLPVMGTLGLAGSAMTGNIAPAALAIGANLAKSAANSRVGKQAASAALSTGARASDSLSKIGDPRLIGTLAAALAGLGSASPSQTSQAPKSQTTGAAASQKSSSKLVQALKAQAPKTPRISGSPYSASPISYNPTAQSNPDQAASSYRDIAARLMPALIQTESAGNPRARSTAGAEGLAQIMPAMQKAYGVTDPFDPEQSRRAGTEILTDELVRFKDIALALAAYNAGSPRVRKAMNRATDTNRDGKISFEEAESYLPRETQNYVRKIAKRLAA
jgi:soluble lytic murein transglycosylase-like protein